jgi:hypothetical protein
VIKDKQYTVHLKCIFCQSVQFELLHEGYCPDSGEMIRCANCGQLNDFTSINNLVINKALKKIEKEVVADVEDELIKMFKKAGFKVK